MVKRALLGSIVGLSALASVASSPAKAITMSGFEWLPTGSPVAGSTTVAGVNISLTSDGQISYLPGYNLKDLRFTYENGPSYDVDWSVPGQSVTDAPETTATWSFSKRITEFSFDIARLAPGELFETSLGVPDSVSGSLAVNGLTIIGTGGHDFNSGTVFYSGLNTNSIEIYYGTQGAGSGLNPGDAGVTKFGITPVPLPATLPMLAAGLVGLGWIRRRQS